ncbi:MAG: hypothetical protein D6788_09725, partial [Planctomycetota bacterium]
EKALRKKMRAVTLLEFLLYLGAAAFVIISALLIYNNVMDSSKTSQAKTQIQTLMSGVRSLYAATGNYSSVSNSVVISAGIPPENMITSSTTLTSPWGGAVTVSGAASTFTVSYANVPQDACVDLLSSGVLNNSNVISVTVGSTTLTNSSDPAAAVTACSAAANNMVFTAR